MVCACAVLLFDCGLLWPRRLPLYLNRKTMQKVLGVGLPIAHDYGATYASLASYMSLIFATAIGALWFGHRLTPMRIIAALAIVATVIIYQHYGRSEEIERQRSLATSSRGGHA